MRPRSKPTRHVRELAVALMALLCAVTSGSANATALMPVFLHQGGPKAVQVEIAAGRVGPCDSSYNALLFKGWIEAGRAVRVLSSYGCVCYRQTYDDFPEVNWSPSTVTCRRICTVQGGSGLCPADANDALSIQIRSSPRG